MPDGSTFNRQFVSDTSSAAEFISDPVAAGYVTHEERQALRRYLANKRAKPKGPADYAALRGRVILHTFWGTPDSAPIYRGSVRYWDLIALWEQEWIGRRKDKSLRPHERAALAMRKCGAALYRSKAKYNEVSRFRLALARECGDQRTAERILCCPRAKRKALLVEAWRKSRLALRRFFAAVDRYRRLRAEFEAAEMTKAADLSDLPQPLSLEVAWREYRKAQRALSKAEDAADTERFRVRKLHPPCPVMMRVGPDDNAREVPADDANIRRWKEGGEISEEEANRMLVDLKHWKESCDAIDQQHIDWSLVRARERACARWRALDRLLIEAPAATLSDVLVKLRAVAEPQDSDPVQEMVCGLVRDIGRLTKLAPAQ